MLLSYHSGALYAQEHFPDGNWRWKYGASDFLAECAAKALCRPYILHHPAVVAASEAAVKAA